MCLCEVKWSHLGTEECVDTVMSVCQEQVLADLNYLGGNSYLTVSVATHTKWSHDFVLGREVPDAKYNLIFK